MYKPLVAGFAASAVAQREMTAQAALELFKARGHHAIADLDELAVSWWVTRGPAQCNVRNVAAALILLHHLYSLGGVLRRPRLRAAVGPSLAWLDRWQ